MTIRGIRNFCENANYSWEAHGRNIFFRPIPRYPYWFPRYTSFCGGSVNRRILAAWKYSTNNPSNLTNRVLDLAAAQPEKPITFYGYKTSSPLAWLFWYHTSRYQKSLMPETPIRAVLVGCPPFIAEPPEGLEALKPEDESLTGTAFLQGFVPAMPGVLLLTRPNELPKSVVPMDSIQFYSDLDEKVDFTEVDEHWRKRLASTNALK